MGQSKGWLKKHSTALLIGIIVLLGCAALFFLFSPMSFTEVATAQDTSQFEVRSYVDGEDVSGFIELSIWTPDPDKTFDETSDWYTLGNFEETVKSKTADDISIDLTGYEGFWVEVDPDGDTVFAQDFHFYDGGRNRNITIDAYHQTSDLNFNIMNSATMAASYNADGNYTVVLDCPHYTTTNLHVGSDWAMKTADFDELTASEKEDYYDEKNYRCQAPVYNPANDDLKEFDSNLAKITDAPCVRITMNDTISKVDGNGCQINCTVNSDYSYLVEKYTSGEYLYFIFLYPMNFKYGTYEFRYEMQFGANITTSTAQSGRVTLPYDDLSGSSFTAYSTIGA